MRVHHLNCGMMTPIGFGRLVCHCLLLETAHGLVLVDSGFGMADIRRPVPRLSRLFIGAVRPELDPLDTAVEQVREFGFEAGAVKHIVLTHLDFDHTGGISDFPSATVHVLADEADAARHRHGFVARRRYRPAQWRGAASAWQEHRTSENWFGFAAVSPLGMPDLLLVRLPGHSAGHCGVAIRDGKQWLLHAGDAYISRTEIQGAGSVPPRALRVGRWLMQTDGGARRATLGRLRELASDQIVIFCAHDLTEFQDRQRDAEARVSAKFGKPQPANRPSSVSASTDGTA